MIVLNANTLAVSTYSVEPLDIVVHDNEVYFVSELGLTKLSASGTETVVSALQTGQLDFGTTIGKRCPSVSLISQNDSIPEVSTIDDALVEYPAGIRQGSANKHTRTYNAQRGVLSTRFGFLIEGEDLDFTDIKAEIIVSATR
jgi:hypothetical protein